MIQQFIVPGRLPGANEYTEANRRHRQAGGRMKRDETDRCASAAATLEPMLGPVAVSFEWHEAPAKKGARLRDFDNVCFGEKFVLDGLVRAGVILDDAWPCVRELNHTFVPEPVGCGHVVVTVSEVRP